MDIELRHLRLLCAVADSGSLSRAAATLGLSQPSVSTSLRRLEEHLSNSLFIRYPSGVKPTELGLSLISQARIVLAETAQLEAVMNPFNPQLPLRIGLSYMSYVPRLIEALDQEFGTRAEFIADGSTASLALDLRQKRADLSVVLVGEDWQHELPAEIHSRTLQASIPVFVALPAHHELAAKTEIPLIDLATTSWISPPGADDGSLAELRRACSDVGFVPQVRMITPTGTGRHIIARNNVVQLVEPTTPCTDGIVTRPLVGDPIRMRLVLAWQRERLSRKTPDVVHRIALDAYTAQARESQIYADWWKRNRQGNVWVKHLDQVFSHNDF